MVSFVHWLNPSDKYTLFTRVEHNQPVQYGNMTYRVSAGEKPGSLNANLLVIAIYSESIKM